MEQEQLKVLAIQATQKIAHAIQGEQFFTEPFKHAVIDDFLQSHDLDYDQNTENTYLITLPGEAKQQTHCALIIGDHSLSINAFVIRKPDENKEKVSASDPWFGRYRSL